MMDRRDALMTTALGAAAVSMTAFAQGAAPAKAPTPPSGIEKNKDIYEAALACIRAGEECLDHCVRSLSTGDKMMAECAGTVRAMLPLCEAVAELARLDSKHLKALAAVCAKACRDCEAACKKHAGHHAECKACMESCKACATACEKA
jgi:Cys-rich four helix bundle protein (predicted Tat secretion target)